MRAEELAEAYYRGAGFAIPWDMLPTNHRQGWLSVEKALAEKGGKTCATCRFFQPFQDNDYCGKCLRYPPTFSSRSECGIPITAHTSFCGEWRA